MNDMNKRVGLLHKVGVGLGLLVVLAASDARADLRSLAGGGWSGPRGDSATYVLNGMTGVAGLELEVGQNLGFMAQGSYVTFDAKASKLKSDLGLPPTDPLNAETSIIGFTVAPKLYLTNRDIAAYIALGGGPRWLTYSTTAAGTGTKSERSEQAWGVLAGFGVDIEFADGFRLGFAPTYHRENAERRPIEYMTFVFYLKL
jgi:Outer membrane protein beta-barrel domain